MSTSTRLALALGGGCVLAGALVYAQVAPTKDQTTERRLPDLQPSKDWQPVTVPPTSPMQSRAWSDPAAGCHLALWALPLPDTAGKQAIAQALTTVMAKSKYTLSPIKQRAQHSQFALTASNLTGIASLHVPEGLQREATLLACYWNSREPAHCKQLCQAAEAKHAATFKKD